MSELQSRVVRMDERVFVPDDAAHEVYRELYALYSELHDAFGERQGAFGHVMKRLLEIRDRVVGGGE